MKKIRKFHYIVRTDASTQEIDAVSIDEAAELFADDEFPGNLIVDVADLFRHVESIGDGAWCWIESAAAPDGRRQSVGC
ncbi:MAG TPA: hypothetical protein VIZ18_09135 [Ktedonobacteraceae bacterium]